MPLRGVAHLPARGGCLPATSTWTATVHALLRHLESAGYRGSPQLVDTGVDAAGRQQLRYVDGELVHPYSWSDRGIIEVARLLRELHDATATFVPPQDAT